MRVLPWFVAIALGGLGLEAAIFRWKGVANAQIVPDATLPQPSAVTRSGNVLQINGGSTAGNNLFHSFSEFSVPAGVEASFANAPTVENIFSRVTGNDVSHIDGLLRSRGTANLFLINPNGIVFGPNARLDLGGSFVASTADALTFADGIEYGAIAPPASPLLSVGVPVGLQMGSNPAPIAVFGMGNNLSVGLEVDRSLRPEGLSTPDRTLALVGGAISFAGGNITAEGGRVEVGSAAGAIAVALEPDPAGYRLQYPDEGAFAEIRLQGAASIDASDGGSLQVRGHSLVLDEESAIVADVTGARSGGEVSCALRMPSPSTTPALWCLRSMLALRGMVARSSWKQIDCFRMGG